MLIINFLKHIAQFLQILPPCQKCLVLSTDFANMLGLSLRLSNNEYIIIFLGKKVSYFTTCDTKN